MQPRPTTGKGRRGSGTQGRPRALWALAADPGEVRGQRLRSVLSLKPSVAKGRTARTSAGHALCCRRSAMPTELRPRPKAPGPAFGPTGSSWCRPGGTRAPSPHRTGQEDESPELRHAAWSLPPPPRTLACSCHVPAGQQRGAHTCAVPPSGPRSPSSHARFPVFKTRPA